MHRLYVKLRNAHRLTENEIHTSRPEPRSRSFTAEADCNCNAVFIHHVCAHLDHQSRTALIQKQRDLKIEALKEGESSGRTLDVEYIRRLQILNFT